MTQPAAVPRPAATLILARNSQHALPEIEVFLMQRTHGAAFMAGAYVFPGGAVDSADSEPALGRLCAALDDATASRKLGMEHGGLAYWVAAIRECYEESGVLMAYSPQGALLTEEELPADAPRRLAAGSATLSELCHSHGWRLATDKMIYFSRWITPPDLPRRYDTRFFIAEAPPRQNAAHDNTETISHIWIAPSEALRQFHAGQMQMAHATVRTLETLAGFTDTAALMRHVRSQQTAPYFNPYPALGRNGRCVVTEEHPAYAEVRKLDPAGSGTAHCEIIPGKVVHLSEKVRRITAPNPSVMTGPGTNTYLLGTGGEIAVIDPGPAIDTHLEALLASAGGRIRWILVTHTHLDHSPAAQKLKQLTGAQLLGMPPPAYARQDQSFVPDRVPEHGEQLRIAGCMVKVLHTPGHASNHLCYLLEDEQILFTGDHIMQGSTVIINPPDGDMAAYLHSLLSLQKEALGWLAPGHGFLMDRPKQIIERLVAHRKARERKVLAALQRLGSATLDQLLPLAYDDISSDRYPAARRSLLAHLLKLQLDGQAREIEENWQKSRN